MAMGVRELGRGCKEWCGKEGVGCKEGMVRQGLWRVWVAAKRLLAPFECLVKAREEHTTRRRGCGWL